MQLFLSRHLGTRTVCRFSSTCCLLRAKRLFATQAHPVSPLGASASYMETLYDEWRSNPQSVSPSLGTYFQSLTDKEDEVSHKSMLPEKTGLSQIKEALKVEALIRSYRIRGHTLARLDPLGILDPSRGAVAPELEPAYYGWTEADLDRHVAVPPESIPFLKENQNPALRSIFDILRKLYCDNIGIEYMHIADPAICDWIRHKFERLEKFQYSSQARNKILSRLLWADSFEQFLHVKYPGEKRFGLDGCESFIPGIKAFIDRSVDLGVDNIVIGMAHRGRLNVLTGVLKKPIESLFYEFNGFYDYTVGGSGDVKYHLGMNCDKITASGKYVHLSLAANPSHLEAVNPVVQGKVKALQKLHGDDTKSKTLGLLVHGDAAFAGQGVVYESLGMSDLPSYETGGIVHIVINNQIGFTTDPRFSRSTPYCTEVAKAISAPILHVNGDDVEAVVFACTFAAEFRNTWKKDIVVDIIGYRRYGHNEFDEPSFTQPKMCQAIARQTRVAEKYASQPFFDKNAIKAMRSEIWSKLEASFKKAKDYKPKVTEWLSSSWHGFKSPKELSEETVPARTTGISLETLNVIGSAISSYPKGFNIHKGLVKILQAREKALESGVGIDMATAEALAFGSLLLEGYEVRLSGQDVERGTFSQRHAVLHDQITENQFIQLKTLDPASQGLFSISNSHLSEFAVLGFELGYSLVSPRTLVVWEAQFGDFANNAQCIIDQFIVSGERKWHQRTGLTMLLPHGYDGNGPEHSSGRPERFLQLCDDDPTFFPPRKDNRQYQDCNLQVIVPTSPSTYFHALRRQLVRDFRKPLVAFTSKALLRHPSARSCLAELGPNTFLKQVIEDTSKGSVASVKKLIFCSGQVYFLLDKARDSMKIKNVAIVRVEEIAPFPFHDIQDQINLYSKKLEHVLWVQEEPLNMGFWSYVEPRLETVLNHSETKCRPVLGVVARDPSAAVSTGLKKVHLKEEEKLVALAFG